MTKNYFLLFLICCLSFNFSNAQNTILHESINASGGGNTNQNASISYSVGQVFYITSTSSDGSLLEGVQQAFEIYPLSVKDEIRTITLTAYPNPTPNLLNIQISDFELHESFTYDLYDMLGKKMLTGRIDSALSQLNLTDYPAAVYTLSLRNKNNKPVRQFKIIKK